MLIQVSETMSSVSRLMRIYYKAVTVQ